MSALEASHLQTHQAGAECSCFRYFYSILQSFVDVPTAYVKCPINYNIENVKETMLSMLFVVYNPPSAYIVGYKTVYLQYIRQDVVKDALVFFVSAICVIIMCWFLLYNVNNSAQYEYYGTAYLSEISKAGHEKITDSNQGEFSKDGSNLVEGS